MTSLRTQCSCVNSYREMCAMNVLIFYTREHIIARHMILVGFLLKSRRENNHQSNGLVLLAHCNNEYYSLFICAVILRENIWFVRIVELLLSSLKSWLSWIVISMNFDLWVKSGNRGWEKKMKKRGKKEKIFDLLIIIEFVTLFWNVNSLLNFVCKFFPLENANLELKDLELTIGLKIIYSSRFKFI